MSEKKRKVGSGCPKEYSQAVREELIELVGAGKSLVFICKRSDMPGRKKVHEWIQKDESFRNKYAQAKELCAEFYADQITDVSQLMVERAMNGQLDKVAVSAVRAHLDTIKWRACHLSPKKYGNNNTICLETSEGKTSFSVHFDESKKEEGEIVDSPELIKD